jgi:hypothetical protein
VRGADAAARVAVEALVEQDVVPEVRVAVQLVVVARHRPAAGRVTQEELG